MRRKDRERGLDFSLPLIDRCSHGVMALTTGEDTPYCLPISLVRLGDSLYFHCAREGRKVDLLRRCPRVCITFVNEDTPAMETNGNYTTYFQSAIVTGTAVEVTEDVEKTEALRALCQKLLPEHMAGNTFDQAIARSLAVTAVWRIDVDQITGKQKAKKV